MALFPQVFVVLYFSANQHLNCPADFDTVSVYTFWPLKAVFVGGMMGKTILRLF
jgi:hypothetical protein